MNGMQAVVVPPIPAFAWLADRYPMPLPNLVDEMEALARRVEEHLQKMGFEP